MDLSTQVLRSHTTPNPAVGDNSDAKPSTEQKVALQQAQLAACAELAAMQQASDLAARLAPSDPEVVESLWKMLEDEEDCTDSNMWWV